MDNLEKLIDEVKIEYGEQNKKKKRFIFKTVKTEDILKLLESNLPLHLQLEVICKAYKIKSNIMSYSNFLKKFYPAEYEAFLLRTGTKKKTKKQNINNDNNVQNNNNDNNNVQNDNNNNVQIELPNNVKTIQHIDNNEFIKKEDDFYVITFDKFEEYLNLDKNEIKSKITKLKQESNLSTYKQKQLEYYNNILKGYIETVVNNEVVKVRFPFHFQLTKNLEDTILLNTEFLNKQLTVGIKNNTIYLKWDALTPIDYYSLDTIQQYQRIAYNL
ncbi:hypothetical protein LF845_06145 [Deferribacterales bacterium Es71-Z0220]|uniref:hypothetical protein n=1 Tax=Deferrivibrio essentukiensis TaxID=2880922 RepID=UPI001F618104|nr:hypothetical protein [Deferrivibrio essentukiensis]MCB4204538.1 hypothetical protein [Deferrivibrio essentukiensis]